MKKMNRLGESLKVNLVFAALTVLLVAGVFLLNGIAMLIALACLWFSHYLLGLTSALADNISANVVGLALGTLFRFWSYRKWVFPAVPADAADEELAERDAVTPI